MLEMAPGTWTVFSDSRADSALLPRTHAMTRRARRGYSVPRHMAASTRASARCVQCGRHQVAEGTLPRSSQRHTPNAMGLCGTGQAGTMWCPTGSHAAYISGTLCPTWVYPK